MNQKFKSFTDGLAIFLAVLIAIYLLTGYIKTDNHKGDPLTMSEKVEKLFSTSSYRVYLNILLLLSFSAAVGIILRRLPWLAVPVAALPLFYELFLLTEKLLTKYPTGVILLTAAHTAGAVAYAAYCDKKRLTAYSSAIGGSLVALFGSAFAGFAAILCERIHAFSDTLALLRAKGIIVHDAVKPLRGAIGRIYSVYLTEGSSAARSLSSDYFETLGKSGARSAFLGSVSGDETRAYAGVCVLFFGAAVLAFVLSVKKLYRLSFAVSAVPAVAMTVLLINEKLSAGGVVLLAASVLSAAVFAAPMAAWQEDGAEDESADCDSDAIEEAK